MRDDLAGKAACKAALQREAGLPVRPDVPLFAFVARLAPQKGVDVLAARARARSSTWDVQLVLLGTGDPEAERFFAARGRAPSATASRAWLRFDDARAHRIEAGADFFLMPSRFEPCGLIQLYACATGRFPIVRATGGLVDTVENYDEATGAGTGFVFHDLDPDSLADTIGWAVSTWYDRPAHIDAMRRRAMREDHSWDRAAREYERLYLAAYARRRGHGFPGTVSTQLPDAAGRAPGVASRSAPARTKGVERLPSPVGRRGSRGLNELSREHVPPRRRVARRAPG